MSEGEQPETTVGQKLGKAFWLVFKIAFALAIIGYLYVGHWGELSKALGKIGNIWFFLGCLAVALLLYFLHFLAGVYRWYLLVRTQDINIGLFEAYSITSQAFFFSLVIPGGSIGGDLVKATFIAAKAPGGRRLEGVLSILIDRIFGSVGLFVVAGAAGLMSSRFLLDMRFEPLAAELHLSADMAAKVAHYLPASLIGLIVLGCVAGLGSVAVMFNYHHFQKIPLVRRSMDVLDRLSHGRMLKLTNALDQYRKAPWVIFWCLVLSVFAVHFNLVCVCYVLGVGLGMAVGSVSFFVFLLAISLGNVAALLPGSFSGVGPRDLVIYVLLRAGGLETGVALAIPMIFSAIVILFNLSGSAFFVIGGKERLGKISE